MEESENHQSQLESLFHKIVHVHNLDCVPLFDVVLVSGN